MALKNKLIIVFALVLLVVIGCLMYQKITLPKTGYVIIGEVYNGFDMKKDMEKKYLQTKQARDKIIDSLTSELNLLAKKIESEQEKNKITIELFTTKREDYRRLKQSYDEDNAALTKQYDQEILTQLNQYVKAYGQKHHYTYIFGNDGNGSLMYAIETDNITQDVIGYINTKYRGAE